MKSEYDPMQLSQYERFCDCKTEDCRCGENNIHEWVWDKNHATRDAVLSANNLEVTFHEGFSNGTAAVRGEKILEKGRHHYWEVKIITEAYGTDIMVGVGTNKVNCNGVISTFCSLLGNDEESFGFSYKGYVQYGGEQRKYGSSFGRGSLVGVYLDTWRGVLEFYVNRKPLGIAVIELRDRELYPMVSSTAAKSKVRLTHSCSIPSSLQAECLATLKPVQRIYLSNTFPGLRHLSESIFADILKRDNAEDETNDNDILAQCILDDFDFALVGIGKKKCKRGAQNQCT